MFIQSRWFLWIWVFALCHISQRALAASTNQLRFSPRDGQQSLALRPNANALRLAKKQTPRSAKTVFFGTCHGNLRRGEKSKAGELAVHFYAVQTRRIKVGNYYQRKFALYCDVFAVLMTKRRQLLRLQHLSLNSKLKCMNGNWAYGSDAINAASFIWLDSQNQIPILRAQMQGEVMSGIAGCDALLVFPQGLRAKPVVQDFEYDGNLQTFFNNRDGRGFLVVRQQRTYFEPDYDKQKTVEHRQKPTYFAWNGKAFVARRIVTKSPSR